MTTPPTLLTLPPGFVINGRYEVRATLGSGANGAVYEVFDHHVQQTSALKFLLRYDPTAPWAEAQMLIGLEGEFILPVRNADHASGTPFVVTEVARNGTLADRVVPQVGLPTPDAVRWTQQACRGIARVHDRGLIHNDIKPDNLFLAANNNVLVGDLGLVSLLDATGHGAVGGTATTMAPEVAAICVSVPPSQWDQHRPTSIASDVYSLGATLYWLLAGQPPHFGANNVFAAVVAGPPTDLLDTAPHVPQGLRDIVNVAMARDPKDRYPSPAALDAALGGRTKFPRLWTRIAKHTGHTHCFRGTGTKSDLAVCAVPVGPKTLHQIEVRHENTGRRVKPWTTVPITQLPRALRTVFRNNQ